MDGRSALREAIMSVPVPGAPPRFSRAEAATGLGYLDATLRLDHVRRLTERLTVVTHRSVHRTTEVDVNLAALDLGPRAPGGDGVGAGLPDLATQCRPRRGPRRDG